MIAPLKNPFATRVALAALTDALATIPAALLVWWLAHPTVSIGAYVAIVAAGAVLAHTTLFYSEAYSSRVLGRGERSTPAVILALGLTSWIALAGGLVLHLSDSFYAAIAYLVVANLGFVLLGRRLFRWLSSRWNHRILVVGASDLGVAIADELQQRPRLGLQLVGFLSDDPALSGGGGRVKSFRVLGPVHHLEKVVTEERIDRIVVASKNRSELFPADELLAYKTEGRIVESGVEFYEGITGKIYLRGLRPSYLVFSPGFRVRPLIALLKRATDIAVSALGLLLASPALALCALAIRLDSPGPILFKQVRVGRGGRRFEIMKFRSMRTDAEAESGAVFAHRGDDRITRIGRLLRRSRLDEVPQLWNVLRGDMSIVGPRPERPEFVESLTKNFGYFRLRSAIRPGLTGWAQVNFGYVNEVEDFEEKLAFDLFYMKHRSLALDVVVLLRTIREIILFKGV